MHLYMHGVCMCVWICGCGYVYVDLPGYALALPGGWISGGTICEKRVWDRPDVPSLSASGDSGGGSGSGGGVAVIVVTSVMVVIACGGGGGGDSLCW
jgi:hypothetical protein